MDHRDFLRSVPAGDRNRLLTLSDRPGLWRLAGHLGVIAGLAVWVGAALPLWPLAMLPLGVTLAFLFTLQHECTHRTPFATPWLNEAVGHLTGVLIAQPFLWFRAFHMAHHRFTNDPENDPELEGAKPEGWSALVWHLAGLDYWRSKLATLARNGFGRMGYPYLPLRQVTGIRAEARAMIALYFGVAIFSVVVSPILLWIWLLPLAIGFPALRLYLLAEHGRCPAVADMFNNTRTTFTNRIVRFLAWNMPYHAEHHTWPQVPFHKLPDLHELTRPHLKRTSDSYVRFTRDYVKEF